MNPVIIGKLVDHVGNHRESDRIIWLLVAFGGILLIRTVLVLFRNFLLQRVGMRVTCDMRISIFSHLQKLSLRFYEARQTGKIVSRVTDDTNAIFMLVTGASINVVSDFITIFGVMIFLLTQNVRLALLTYAVLPFFLINYIWHRRRMRMESRRHRRNWDKVMGFLYERIASTRLIKSFATESSEIDAFRDGIEADFINHSRLNWRNSLLGAGAEMLNGLGTLVVLAYGSWLAYNNIDHFTVGKLVAFSLYLGLLYAPIVRTVESNTLIQRAVTALEKIFTLLDTKPQVPDNEKKPTLPDIKGKITFDHVCFSYGSREAVINDISFTVEPGQMVALVGPSGAGKSTIISLLARFYEPLFGHILIDDQDIQLFNAQSVRRQIGLVMQDSVLFSGTIAENIKYGRPDATHAEVIEAAQAANAHEFILELSKGYMSKVGERGVQLSGGQRQRIAIARVILKNPRILIFDEATSALDTHTERLIQEAMERVMRGRTSFVIAHRLSTITNANQIFVMESGRLAECGTHVELLQKGGLFRKLHDLQFSEKTQGEGKSQD